MTTTKPPRVITYVNEKPGTAKTTSAVLTAQALHEDGWDVVLIDGDINGKSVMRWHNQIGGFGFRVMQLPSNTMHREIPKLIPDPKTRVVIDAPPLENQPGVARSAMRAADRVIVPVAPSSMEIERMGDIRDEIEDIGPLTQSGELSVQVLLNRCITQARKNNETYRAVLRNGGWDVLNTWIPTVLFYQNAWGTEMEARESEYDQLIVELGLRQTRDGFYKEAVDRIEELRSQAAQSVEGLTA
jgi:chromosome partitioning protein